MTVSITANEIKQNVTQALAQVQTVKDALMSDVNSFLTELKQASLITPPIFSPDFNNVNPQAFPIGGEPPERFNPDSEIDSAFSGLTRPASIASLDVSTDNLSDITVPEFEAQTPELDIQDIEDPTLPNLPSEPSIADISKPNKPSYSLPSAPTIRDISVTPAPSLIIPTYVNDFPTDDLILPVNTFAFTEPAYISELLDALKAKVINDVQNGATGLGADVSRLIWDLQRELNDKSIRDAMDNFYAEFSGNGYDLPTGVVAANIRKIQSDYADKQIDSSRIISIEEAKMALQHTEFSTNAGIQIEAFLLQYHNNVAERALNVAKATVDIAIAIFNTAVAYHNTKVQAAQIRAQVYETQVRAILAQAEIYRTQLEGDKLSVEVQAQYVEIYKAQLQAVQVISSLYETDMKAASIEAQIEELKIQAYKGKVDAYSAGVAGAASKYQAYRLRLEGQLAKVSIFETQAKAYSSQMDGIKTRAGIQEAIVKTEVDVQRLKLEEQQNLVSYWKAQADIALGKVGVLVDMYKADASIYAHEIGKSTAEAELELKNLEISVRNAQHNLSLALENSRNNLYGYLQAAQIRNTAAQGGASITGNLIGAIYNSIQAIAHEYAGGTVTATEAAA